MSTAAISQTASTDSQAIQDENAVAEGVVLTRFGAVPATKEQQVKFKGGLPGFPGFECYQLEYVPNVQGDLMLLQSVDDAEVAFFVLPLVDDGSAINSDDVKSTCKQLGIDSEQLLMLTVVNLQRNDDVLEKYINLRAPIFIDKEKQTGAQYVLPNANYPLRLRVPEQKPA